MPKPPDLPEIEVLLDQAQKRAAEEVRRRLNLTFAPSRRNLVEAHAKTFDQRLQAFRRRLKEELRSRLIRARRPSERHELYELLDGVISDWVEFTRSSPEIRALRQQAPSHGSQIAVCNRRARRSRKLADSAKRAGYVDEAVTLRIRARQHERLATLVQTHRGGIKVPRRGPRLPTSSGGLTKGQIPVWDEAVGRWVGPGRRTQAGTFVAAAYCQTIANRKGARDFIVALMRAFYGDGVEMEPCLLGARLRQQRYRDRARQRGQGSGRRSRK